MSDDLQCFRINRVSHRGPLSLQWEVWVVLPSYGRTSRTLTMDTLPATSVGIYLAEIFWVA